MIEDSNAEIIGDDTRPFLGRELSGFEADNFTSRFFGWFNCQFSGFGIARSLPQEYAAIL